eukprot:TRINITY_DN5142_c0_g1_i1.p2 TRINITY_DN5142_c0_g1~~TRINITY_DN5142_c0_g1_i1.p2  ORF type:complete len:146 (-),score=28.93 TRINITY_DN5142_c0_g1_i1:8-445(-)
MAILRALATTLPPITDIQFSADGNRLLCVAAHKELRVIDYINGSVINENKQHRVTSACFNSESIFAACHGDHLRVYNTVSGRPGRVIEISGGATSVAGVMMARTTHATILNLRDICIRQLIWARRAELRRLPAHIQDEIQRQREL